MGTISLIPTPWYWSCRNSWYKEITNSKSGSLRHQLARQHGDDVVLSLKQEEIDGAEGGHQPVVEGVELLAGEQRVEEGVRGGLGRAPRDDHVILVEDDLLNQPVLLHQPAEIGLLRLHQLVQQEVIVAVDRVGDLVGFDDLKFDDRQDLLDFDAALRESIFTRSSSGEEQVAVAVARVRNREDKDPAALPPLQYSFRQR